MEGLQKIANLEGEAGIPKDKVMVFVVNDLSGGEGEEFKMWAMQPPSLVVGDEPCVRRARAKTCGSNHVPAVGLTKANWGEPFERMEEVLVTGLKAPGFYQEDKSKREWNKAILNLGCLVTVAGAEWMDNFSGGVKRSVEWFATKKRSLTGFNGGDDMREWAVILHMRILGGYGKLLVHVLDTETPLLLFHPSMDTIGLIIDPKEQTVK